MNTLEIKISKNLKEMVNPLRLMLIYLGLKRELGRPFTICREGQSLRASQYFQACLEMFMQGSWELKSGFRRERIRKYPGILPKALNQATTRIWGFSSKRRKYLREGYIAQIKRLYSYILEALNK